MSEKSYVETIATTLAEEMQRDEKVFMVGESLQGGSFGHTTGFVDAFGPERILDAPIAETGIAGAGIGAAMCGYRPIVDLMFADFMYVAGDEIFLKAAQWRFMHGGNVELPLTFLGAVGGGLMLANEHSQVPIAQILHKPGIKCVMPSTPYDAKGLLKTSIRENNPVFFFYHKALMHTSGEVPDEEYLIPLGQADVKREGTDVTVVAGGMMLHHSLAAAEKLDGSVSLEIIDPRSYEPLDLDTILKSVEKTGRVLIVDEDTERCGFAGELGFQIMDKAFDLLDAPIKRVAALNYPIPGGHMEKYCLPNPEKVAKAAMELMGE